MRDVSAGEPPHGFLRLLVVFHESEALGAGRSVLNALEPLTGYGWTASAWLPGDGPLLDEARGSIAAHASFPKPIRYSVRGWRSEPGFVPRLRRTPAYLRRFRDALLRLRPHVVHANTLRTLPEARVAKMLGLPLVLHVHELPPPSAKRTLALRAASGLADVFVAVSSAVADMLEPHAGSTPIVVARNGVRAPGVTREAADEPVVGTIGTVCRAKGTDVFLEAVALAHRLRPDLRFEHVGQSGLDDDEQFADLVRARAEEPDVRDALDMLGRRPASDALAGWETFVLPSREDAFPLASLEAMAAGVPVIATSVGGIPEQIEHLESGVLVEPDRPHEVADWIVRLHDEPALRERLAAGAVARVRERFTVERQAERLHEAYLGALNLRHGPPPVRRRTLETLGA